MSYKEYYVNNKKIHEQIEYAINLKSRLFR